MSLIPGEQVTVQMQLMQFAESFLLGFPAGVLLEIFRTLRAVFPHHAIIVFLEDAIFSFSVCFLLQCYAWMFADGVLRWYHAAGALFGLCVWMLTAGALWIGLLRRICRIGRGITGGICRIVAKKVKRGKNIPENT